MLYLNKSLQFSLEILLLFSFFSCEGGESAKGIIYNVQSAQPIDSVLCRNLTYKTEMLTDSSGYYQLHNPIKGCINGCEPLVVEFSKEGYVTKTFTNPGESNIFLQPE